MQHATGDRRGRKAAWRCGPTSRRTNHRQERRDWRQPLLLVELLPLLPFPLPLLICKTLLSAVDAVPIMPKPYTLYQLLADRRDDHRSWNARGHARSVRLIGSPAGSTRDELESNQARLRTEAACGAKRRHTGAPEGARNLGSGDEAQEQRWRIQRCLRWPKTGRAPERWAERGAGGWNRRWR